MTRTLVLIALSLIALPPEAAAQVVPTEYTANVHLEATQTGTPVTTFDFAKSAVQCDQVVQPVTGVQANPRFIRFTDPERPTRDCVYDTGNATGPLHAMPIGGRYVVKLVSRVVVGGVPFNSPLSDASNPFVRGAAPAAAAAVRIGG